MDGPVWGVLVNAFVAFFVIIDPPGIMPVFGALVDGTDKAHQRLMAVRSVAIAAVVLLLFALLGERLLLALGIGMPAFRVAGGIMLLLLALEMVFEKRGERREKRVEGHHEADGHEDISVFPMAIPMIAGPGALTSVVLLMSQHAGNMAMQAAVLGMLGLVLVLCLVMFLASASILALAGKTFSQVVTRTLGIILAALAVQFIFDGARVAFAG